MSTGNPTDFVLSHIYDFRDKLFTAMPATIESTEDYEKTATISVRPNINYLFSDGSSEELPIIQDVPVQFPSGGGAVMTFPIEKGDEVLLVFSMRSIEEWQLSSGGNVTPSSNRWHDMNDAVAIVGIFRDENAPSPSKDHFEIKWDDTVFRITKDKNIEVVTKDTLSINNTQFDLVTELINTLNLIKDTTVITMMGAQPLVNKVAIEAQIAKLETFQE